MSLAIILHDQVSQILSKILSVNAKVWKEQSSLGAPWRTPNYLTMQHVEY